MKNHLLVVGIIFLFLSSVVAPMTTGIDTDSEVDVDPLRDYYGCYNLEEIPESIRPILTEDEEIQDIFETDNIVYSKSSYESLIGPPMNSAWSMYCHDLRHTGRSPFSTVNTTGIEKWRFDTIEECSGSPVIDENGIIYIGARGLFAVYPNGTMKWMYDDTEGRIVSAPAIDENGILYVGVMYGNRFFAIDTNDGKVKWNFWDVSDDVWSSPAIGEDGTIYFGSEDDYIYALNQNGTLKWKYKTSVAVFSSPAIGTDGTIYCGSHDTNLYAFHPNNGTVKWKYKTGHWIRTSPCIGDDGTIYCVSLDNYLHAVYPNNGTRKWRTNVGAGTSPTIGQDGTIYCGYRKLHAVNPSNGSKKWSFDIGHNRFIRGGTPCNSVDGAIYFGVDIGDVDGGEIIAVNPEGIELWRKEIASTWIMSAPAIGEDGTVYIGTWDNGLHNEWGYLHAFGYPGPNPFEPTINGPSSGKPNTPYTYKFTSIDPDGDDVSYFIDWGDGNITDWTGYHTSGESYSKSYTWTTKGTYVIRAKAKDTNGYESDWGTLTVTIPRDKSTDNMLVLRILERFPLLQQLLDVLRDRIE
jgi:outer membrane protein assembly factor BamB